MNNSNRFFSPLSMGEGLGVRLLFTLSLTLFGLASCTQESFAPAVSEVDGERHEIVLSANLGDIGAEVTPATRVDADPTKMMILYFLRNEKDASGNWPSHTTHYPTFGTITATRAAGTGNQTISFDLRQYYPMGKLAGQESANSYNDVSFFGWTGAVGSWETTNGGQVKVPLDGTQDLMLSNMVVGSYTNQFTSSANTLSFKHVMAKLIVQVKVADAMAPARWGALTAVSVCDQPEYCTLDGASASSKCTFSTTMKTNALEGFFSRAMTSSYQTAGTLFIKPDVSSVKLSVTTVFGGTRDVIVTLPSGNFTAGTAYTVSLDFKSTEIAPLAVISAWTTGSGVSTDL